MARYFEKTGFSEDDLKSRLHETAYLNPNLVIDFVDLVRGKGDEEVTYSRSRRESSVS